MQVPIIRNFPFFWKYFGSLKTSLSRYFTQNNLPYSVRAAATLPKPYFMLRRNLLLLLCRTRCVRRCRLCGLQFAALWSLLYLVRACPNLRVYGPPRTYSEGTCSHQLMRGLLIPSRYEMYFTATWCEISATGFGYRKLAVCTYLHQGEVLLRRISGRVLRT